MVEVAGGERAGEDDHGDDDDVGVDGADKGADDVDDDDHGNVFDVDVERKERCKWLQESDWAAL